jgi:hypothetical protein
MMLGPKHKATSVDEVMEDQKVFDDEGPRHCLLAHVECCRVTTRKAAVSQGSLTSSYLFPLGATKKVIPANSRLRTWRPHKPCYVELMDKHHHYEMRAVFNFNMAY